MGKGYLICVDSDGCAMDTMNSKHKLCFGPALVEEWELWPWREEILKQWEKMNLYSMDRGINRFAGLAKMLCIVNERYTPIEGLAPYLEWAGKSQRLSEEALLSHMQESKGVCFAKALSWSRRVNEKIAAMAPEEKRAFPGVKEALERARLHADVAVVSSANKEAVEKEWEEQGILKYVDWVLTQSVGSKKDILAALLQNHGYEVSHVLMIGDAPGDARAAQDNHILFYPILPGAEEASWRDFPRALSKMLQGAYQGQYQKQLLSSFYEQMQ